MRRTALLVAAAAAVVGAGFATGYVHTYSGLNAGIVIGSLGYELVGDPGWFTEPAELAGCYLTDIGSPGQPWPVLVSDQTPDGLCAGRS